MKRRWHASQLAIAGASLFMLAAAPTALASDHTPVKGASYSGPSSERGATVTFSVSSNGKSVRHFRTTLGYNGACGQGGGIPTYSINVGAIAIKKGKFQKSVKVKVGALAAHKVKISGSFGHRSAHGSLAVLGAHCVPHNGKNPQSATFTARVQPKVAGLQPSPVGSGQCQAFQFQDRSVVGQFATKNTSCGVAAAVARGADTARGASYSSNGFSCKATREGPGSKWSSAWGGTYYAYSCAKGSAGVAFNWGTDYTY